MRWSRTVVFAIGLAAAVLAGVQNRAVAQTAAAPDELEAPYKGTVGLGLVGAELGFVIPAVAGLHETWAFITFPIVGATGGALAGYFLLDDSGQTELSVASLAFGMAMAIPSLVLTLSATAYDPEDEPSFRETEETTQAALAPRRTHSEASRVLAKRARDTRRPAAGGLLRIADDSLSLGLPSVSAVPVYTQDELRRFQVTQRSEIRLSVLIGRF